MIVNCKRCDRIFQKTVRDICPMCVQQEREAFETIRAFLKEHPNSTLPQVVEGTQIELEVIVDLIHEGILILREYPNLSLQCERCGVPTQDGRFCKKCSDALVMELANATQQVRRLKQESHSGGYYSK